MYIDQRILMERIRSSDLVLDIGGWDRVFPRANYVIDVMPYETRRNHSKEKELFGRDTWIQADVHDKNVWESFTEKQFDFVIASHILEDIRDPIFLINEIQRVGKAGYIEVPSIFREVSKLSPHDYFTGYDHHRWLIWADEAKGKLFFKPKLARAWTDDRVTGQYRELLSDYHYQFDSIFWNEGIDFEEVIPNGWEDENQWLSKLIFKTISGSKPRQYIFSLSK